jgi:hypothetical protein
MSSSPHKVEISKGCDHAISENQKMDGTGEHHVK